MSTLVTRPTRPVRYYNNNIVRANKSVIRYIINYYYHIVFVGFS